MKLIILNLMTLLKNKRHDQTDISDQKCKTFLIKSDQKKVPVTEISLKRWTFAFEDTNWLGPKTFELDLGCEKKIHKESPFNDKI